LATGYNSLYRLKINKIFALYDELKEIVALAFDTLHGGDSFLVALELIDVR